jgi:hypothetical protein
VRWGDRKAGIVYLSGSVVLTEPGGLSRGFRSQAIGFEDGYGTTLGQCVWTDERGDQIFFDLKGVPTETGRHIVGTVTGGTGRYAGLIGEYEFDWRYLIAGPDGELQGWRRPQGSHAPAGSGGGAAMSPEEASRRRLIARGATLLLALAIWCSPVPAGLSLPAWHLFAIFVAAIFSVIAGALTILNASLFAVGAAVVSGTVTPANAYSGFANGTILLIVIAFLVARAVVKSGLGRRLGYVVVSLFGKSTLGLGYSVFLLDAVIAPAFPSNTARSGVLYPIIYSLAQANGSRPEDGTHKRVGSYLMFSGIASLTLSSALWLTAMAGNPIGAEVAKGYGLTITFGSWLVAACVPSLVAIATLPLVLYRVFPPEVKSTPEAPVAARSALHEMGPLTTHERWVAVTFVTMVGLWALAGVLARLHAWCSASACPGTEVLTPDDIAQRRRPDLDLVRRPVHLERPASSCLLAYLSPALPTD